MTTEPMIIDSFAGGGGASTCIAKALVAANASHLAVRKEAA